MIIYDDVFTDSQVEKILKTIDNERHPARWMFRDDALGVRFIYYSKWLDEMETDYHKVISQIFESFCHAHNIVVEEVHMSRITLMVQNSIEQVVRPEDAYVDAKHRFLYIVSESDRPIFLNGKETWVRPGMCILLDDADTYAFVVPELKNFFMVVEVEFS